MRKIYYSSIGDINQAINFNKNRYRYDGSSEPAVRSDA